MPRRTVSFDGLGNLLLLDPPQFLIHGLSYELGKRPVPPSVDKRLDALNLRRLDVYYRFAFRTARDG